MVNVKVACIRPRGYQDLRAWTQKPGNVYIGRPGVLLLPEDTQSGRTRFPPQCKDMELELLYPWANPYKIPKGSSSDEDRKKVLEKYEDYIKLQIAHGKVDLQDLVGSSELGCWCSPLPCHGNILGRLIQEHNAKKDPCNRNLNSDTAVEIAGQQEGANDLIAKAGQ